MKKKILTILFAFLISVSLILTACGGSTEKKEEINKNEAIEENEENKDASADDLADAADDEKADGRYSYDLGDGYVIKTKNDLKQFIHDGTFDFYEMMDFFGVTGRVDAIDQTRAYWATSSQDNFTGSVRLYGGSSDPHFGKIEIEYGNSEMYWSTEFFIGEADKDRYVLMPSGYKASEEILALLLYEMEAVEEYGKRAPYVTRENLQLPEKYSMNIIEN